MFASFKKMAEGVNLQSANHVIFVDLWWNPQKHFQVADRIHRLRQKKQCFVYYFIYDDGIKEVDDCFKIMENKIEETNEVLQTTRIFPEHYKLQNRQNILAEFETKLNELFKDYKQPAGIHIAKSAKDTQQTKPSISINAEIVQQRYDKILQQIEFVEREINSLETLISNIMKSATSEGEYIPPRYNQSLKEKKNELESLKIEKVKMESWIELANKLQVKSKTLFTTVTPPVYLSNHPM